MTVKGIPMETLFHGLLAHLGRETKHTAVPVAEGRAEISLFHVW